MYILSVLASAFNPGLEWYALLDLFVWIAFHIMKEQVPHHNHGPAHLNGVMRWLLHGLPTVRELAAIVCRSQANGYTCRRERARDFLLTITYVPNTGECELVASESSQSYLVHLMSWPGNGLKRMRSVHAGFRIPVRWACICAVETAEQATNTIKRATQRSQGGL